VVAVRSDFGLSVYSYSSVQQRFLRSTNVPVEMTPPRSGGVPNGEDFVIASMYTRDPSARLLRAVASNGQDDKRWHSVCALRQVDEGPPPDPFTSFRMTNGVGR
jgi:hypothetical protein